MEGERSKKTCEKRSQKSANICHKFRPKGGSPKLFFSCFFECPPEMASKASPDRRQGPKTRENQGPEMDFLRFD